LVVTRRTAANINKTNSLQKKPEIKFRSFVLRACIRTFDWLSLDLSESVNLASSERKETKMAQQKELQDPP